MRSVRRGPAAIALTLVSALILVLAACGGGSPTTPAATTAAGTTPPGTSGAGPVPCEDSTDATDVAVAVADNTWEQPINASVGDVITWTNGDTVPHKVGLDDGSCAMGANIAGGGSGSLVFNVAGSFPFHCTVHPNMRGTITIS